MYEAIKAYADINNYKTNYSFIIAGDGKELESVKSYVSENGIEGIVFTGFLTGVSKIKAYLDAHIFLFPTYNEGMPNSVLEAMACGLPVLNTSVGGIPDIFINEVNGYIIDINNIP
ncbi:MAG: glycosyltransferase family 4 protein [Ignavibacteriales bacterium]|nr:glycosyltransferase family 4 protein [Ignavibacteriales bacterium]